MRPAISALAISSVVLAAGCGSGDPPSSDEPLGAGSAAVQACPGKRCGDLLASWDGLSAYVTNDCLSPVRATAANAAHLGGAGVETDTAGFQCVELAVRHFHFNGHIDASLWNVQSAWQMCGQHPAGVSVVSSPEPGDLAVFSPNVPSFTGPDGHVAVVTSVSGSSMSVLEQNVEYGTHPCQGTRTLAVSRARCFLRAPTRCAVKCGSVCCSSGDFCGSRGGCCDGTCRPGCPC